MSHHLYNTPGIILESRPAREANRLYVILTKDLGVVWASAQAVRKPHSKLRAGLQDFSWGLVSLIRGKDYWKIINISNYDNLYFHFRDNQKIVRMFARVFSLIIRLMPGEEAHPGVYRALEEGIGYLMAESEETTKAEGFTILEHILVIRILFELGYISENEDLKPCLNSEISLELMAFASAREQVLVAEINRSLRETQL